MPNLFKDFVCSRYTRRLFSICRNCMTFTVTEMNQWDKRSYDLLPLHSAHIKQTSLYWISICLSPHTRKCWRLLKSVQTKYFWVYLTYCTVTQHSPALTEPSSWYTICKVIKYWIVTVMDPYYKLSCILIKLFLE
jgi:hypothetical protein